MKRSKKIKVEQIPSSEDTTLYKKVGKRYEPVSEHISHEYYTKGSYLVVVRPGSTSVKYSIDPKSIPEVEAALKICGDGMLHAMYDMSNKAALAETQPLTKAQNNVLKLLKKHFVRPMLQFPSNYDIVEAGLNELREYFEEIKDEKR